VNKWPDFFIVGAAKSGTTSLYHYLREHPSIFMSSLKEPRFFTVYGEEFINPPPNFQIKIVGNTNEYLSLFRDANQSQIKGEASTIYLFLYQKAIQNMAKLMENYQAKKIIIILRNPVERAFSHYQMYLLGGHENEIFSQAIQNNKRNNLLKQWPFYDYISPGFYSNQVKAYLSQFNKVFVCLHEDLKYDTPKIIKKMYDFLDVDPSFTPNYKKNYNQGGTDRIYTGMKGNLRRAKHYFEASLGKKNFYPYPYKSKNDMYQDYCKVYNKLASIFKKDIVILQEYIERDLSSWML